MKDPSKFQHQGFGILLMEMAEKIAKYEHFSTKISVISGILVLYSRSSNSFKNFFQGLVPEIIIGN